MNPIISIAWFVVQNLPWWQALFAVGNLAAKMNPIGIAIMIGIMVIQIAIFLIGLKAQRCI